MSRQARSEHPAQVAVTLGERARHVDFTYWALDPSSVAAMILQSVGAQSWAQVGDELSALASTCSTRWAPGAQSWAHVGDVLSVLAGTWSTRWAPGAQSWAHVGDVLSALAAAGDDPGARASSPRATELVNVSRMVRTAPTQKVRLMSHVLMWLAAGSSRAFLVGRSGRYRR